MLLVILTMEEGKGEEKGKEAEVVVPTEVVIMVIIWMVDNMTQAIDMPKVARITADRGIVTMGIRISTNRLTNLLNLSSTISSNGNSNSNMDPASSFKGTNLEAGVLATMEGETEAAVTGAWVHLIIFTARATGKPIVPHS